ncbi:hypothetical protein AKJ38_01545 [candidate division MSBL1 archaeon SCGC-AAA259I14]|uniref:Uncharacterized protein n=1 Tax=candidate division MSBL1 archaeon SCGC-AAA259I14 TaxID=1698268 RepID=A0A133USY0_9EURY|nr:hypothetical protein AKJ38_01545 [candidate division MSBL1 archaeon SCGC-AAA259I14]
MAHEITASSSNVPGCSKNFLDGLHQVHIRGDRNGNGGRVELHGHRLLLVHDVLDLPLLPFEIPVRDQEMEEGKATYYIPDPGPVLSRFRDKVGGKWLLMSATVQDEEVLN